MSKLEGSNNSRIEPQHNNRALSSTTNHTLCARTQVRKNIQHILGITLPSPKMSQRSDFASECGICYSYRLHVAKEKTLNDEEEKNNEGNERQSCLTPDIACENKKCGRPFHSKCLVEWLQSIPTVRRSFGTLFGSCPYCSTAIAVSSKFN